MIVKLAMNDAYAVISPLGLSARRRYRRHDWIHGRCGYLPSCR